MPLSKNVATNIQHNILGAMEQKRDAWASPDEMADVVKIARKARVHSRPVHAADAAIAVRMVPAGGDPCRQRRQGGGVDGWLRNDLVRQQLGTGPADALLACLQQSGRRLPRNWRSYHRSIGK